MTAPRSYLFSTIVSWGLTGSGGLLAVVGVVAAFMPVSALSPDSARGLCVLGFAGLMGFSVACGNCTASAAAHAVERGRFVKAVFWPAAVCTVGFAGLSAIGIHLGWAILAHGAAISALPADWVVNTGAAFAALAKPAMSWIIEGRKAIDAIDAEERERKEEARLESARARDREATWSGAERTRVKAPHASAAARQEQASDATSGFGASEHQRAASRGGEPTGARQLGAAPASAAPPRAHEPAGAGPKGSASRRTTTTASIATGVGLAMAATIASGGGLQAPNAPRPDLSAHETVAPQEIGIASGPSDHTETTRADATNTVPSAEFRLRGTGAWSALGGTDARVLSRRERRDLALGLRGAMRPDAIAAALRVDRSTVYRWFQKADQQTEIAGA